MTISGKQLLTGAVAIAVVLVLAGALVLWTGAVSFAADLPHSPPVSSMIEFARERSVRVRAADIAVPSLADPGLVTKGAGNYQSMCAQCHQAPGEGPTELSRGLYPAPPNLSLVAVDPAKAFWVIKHGIKASGMPAWGESMEDAYIWNMVAFLQTLPELDAAEYRELVGQSGGHSHGGGESDGHAHADAPEAPESAGAVSSADADAPAEPRVHEHADGSLHDHGPPAPVPEAEPRVHEHDDGSLHDHGPPVTTTDPDPDVPEPTPAATTTGPATAPPDPASATAPDEADESATPDPAEHDEHTDHH